MGKRYWRIRGYKQFVVIFDKTVPVDCLTEKQVKALLQCLAAKEGLSYDEIIGVYQRRGSKGAHEALEVCPDPCHPNSYRCGNHPDFSAYVVDEEGRRIVYPQLL